MATENRLICSKCGQEADAGFFFCPRCGEKLVIADGAAKSGKKRFSLMRLAGDDAKWYQPAFKAFPSVIAHEYWRLHDFCQQDNPYGALIQVKDVLETVIKFQLLCCAAWAMQHDPPKALQELICEVTSPRMALGTWCDFGVAFERVLKSESNFELPQLLSQPLAETLRQYNAKQIVYWRNNMIGHGALGFSEDAEFQWDMEDKIGLLVKLFGKIGPQLMQQKLMAGDRELMGHGLARHLPECRELFVRLGNGERFSVDPYIRMMEDAPPANGRKAAGNVAYGIYFYDNQNDRLRRSELLSYPSGKRKHAQIGMFLEMSEARVKHAMANTGRAVDDPYKTQDDDAMIDQLLLDRLEQEFIEPDVLMDWLRGELSAREKGVLLLQMPRGTGKSTFAEKLNSLNRNPLAVDPLLDVRTYHISRTQLMSADDFEATVEAMWERSFDHHTRWSASAMPRMYRMIQDGMTRGQALTTFLNECVRYTKQQRGKSRILMVLDGLDEIVDDSLWEYMSVEAEALENGVYLLLTARTMQDMRVDKNVSPDVLQRVETLAHTGQLSLEHTGKAYRAFLHKYLDNTAEADLAEDEKEDLMRRADYRVLYLGMLCKLLGSGLSPREVRDTGHLVWMYLHMLTACYGEKEAEHLRELLAVLCTFGKYEPLSLQEIAELTWNRGVVTIDLLGKMNDIAPLLKAQRGFFVSGQAFTGVTRYSLANPDLITAFKRMLGNADEVVGEKVEQAIAYICENPTDVFRQQENASFTQAMELVASLLFKVMRRRDAVRLLDRYEDWAERFAAYADGLRYDADAIAYDRVGQMLSESANRCEGANRLEKTAFLVLAMANLGVQVGRRQDAHGWAEFSNDMFDVGEKAEPWQMEPDRVTLYMDVAQIMLEGYNSSVAKYIVQAGGAQLNVLFAQGRTECVLPLAKSYLLKSRLEADYQFDTDDLLPGNKHTAFAMLIWAVKILSRAEVLDDTLLCMLHERAGDVLMTFGPSRRQAAIREYQWAQDLLARTPKTALARARGLSIEEKLLRAEDLDAYINQCEQLDRLGALTDRTRLIRAYTVRLRELYEKRRPDAETCKPLLEKTQELLRQLSALGGLMEMEEADVLLLTVRVRLMLGEQAPQINNTLKRAADLYEKQYDHVQQKGVEDAKALNGLNACCKLGRSLERRAGNSAADTEWETRGKKTLLRGFTMKWLGKLVAGVLGFLPWIFSWMFMAALPYSWLASLAEVAERFKDVPESMIKDAHYALSMLYALFRIDADQMPLILLRCCVSGMLGSAVFALLVAVAIFIGDTREIVKLRREKKLRWWLRKNSINATRFLFHSVFFLGTWIVAWATLLLAVDMLSGLGIDPEVIWGSSFFHLGAAVALWGAAAVGASVWMRRSVCIAVLYRRFRKWAERCERKRPSDGQGKNAADIHDSDNGRKERRSHK